MALGVSTIGALSSENAPVLLVAALFPFAAIVIGRLRELFLAIAVLDIAVGFDINFAYREDLAQLGALGGLNVSATTIAILVLYLLWAGEFVCKKRPFVAPHIGDATPFILYVALVSLSAIVAADSMLSLFQIFLLGQMLLLYLYIANRVQSRQDILFVVTLLLVGLVIEGLIMEYLHAAKEPFAIGAITTQVDSTGDFFRVGGTVGSPNNAAGFLGMLLLIGISVLFSTVPRGYKALSLLALVLGGMALILTFSRGGWGSFVVSLAVLLFLAWRGGQLSLGKSLTIVLVTILLSLVFHDVIFDRLAKDDGGAAYSRIPLMKLAFRMIKDHLWLGVGANNFALAMEQYVTPQLDKEWLYTVHNRYLLIWAESGLVSLLMFLWFLAATIRAAWQCVFSRDGVLAPLAVGITAAILGHIAHMFVDVFNGRPLLQLLCVLAGVVSAMSAILRAQSLKRS